MKTNFFEQVAGLAITGNLQINIHQHESGTQTVSVLITGANPKPGTATTLPPMLLKGSPQELDEAFFMQIAEPVKQTVKLFSNRDAYQKELEKAKKQNTTGDKKSPAKPAPKDNLFNQQATEAPDNDDEDNDPDEETAHAELLAEKQRLYEEAMQKASTLATQMKFTEAIAQLPDADDYPDKAGEIKAKAGQLKKRQEVYASLQQEI